MELKHLEQAHHIMNEALIPETTKSSLQAALSDASLRGFHIDVEQLQANLSRLAVEARY